MRCFDRPICDSVLDLTGPSKATAGHASSNKPVHSAPSELSALRTASLDLEPAPRRPRLPPWAFLGRENSRTGSSSADVLCIELNPVEVEVVTGASFRLGLKIRPDATLHVSRQECISLMEDVQQALDGSGSPTPTAGVKERRHTFSGSTADPVAFHRRASRLLVKLVACCGRLPSSLFLTGVELPDRDPFAGGGFADIFRGSLDGVPVAMKRLRVFASEIEGGRFYQNFAEEVLTWRQLDHAHILPFFGVDTETFPRQMCMVSPWMPNGNVHSFLTSHPKWRVEPFLRQAADGLLYLHALSIAHGDLRAANVLVDANCQVRLADFGLAVMVSETASLGTTAARGASRWMAPELQDPEEYGLKTSQPNPRSDVYSFACLCLELYTLKVPFSHLRNDATVVHRVLRGDRPPRPVQAECGDRTLPDHVWETMESCWNAEPRLRPDTDEVVIRMWYSETS